MFTPWERDLTLINFYHLTRSKSLKGIVATTDRRRRKGKYQAPLECRAHADEASNARICVASTVWQCLISMTDTQTLYIYHLTCKGAFRPSAEHKVLDAAITDEHWITDAVIEQNEGLIPVKKVGLLRGELLSSTRLRITRWKDNQTVVPTSLNEREYLWMVDESHASNEWRLRDGVGLADGSEELDDESPLELPRWNWC